MATDFGPAEFATDMPALDRGACPMCGREFDDRAAFRDHLGEAHDLYDDQGTETRFVPPLLDPAPPRSRRAAPPVTRRVTVEPALPTQSARGTTPTAPPPERDVAREPRRRLVAVLALVLVAVLVPLGLVVAGGGQDDPSRLAVGPSSPEASDVAPPAGTRPDADRARTVGRSGTGAAPGSAVPGSAVTGGAPAGGLAPGSSTTGSGASSSPSPTGTTVTRGEPTTTAPVVGFDAPRAIEARIHRCEANKGSVKVIYRWRFSGGNEWHAPESYTALGGGWYQHAIVGSTQRGVVITEVQVLDQGGGRHSVRLEPALSSADC